MPKMKYRIGIDLDDTTLDFTGALRRYYRLQRPGYKELPPIPSKWDFHLEWDLSKGQLRDLMESFAKSGEFRRLNLLPVAKENLQRLSDDGHVIVLNTARGTITDNRIIKSQVYADTVHSLIAQNLPYDELHFGEDKGNVYVDIAFDDAVHQLQAIRERHGLSTKTVCLTQPHNEYAGSRIRTQSALDAYELYRVNHWNEFYDLVTHWSHNE